MNTANDIRTEMAMKQKMEKTKQKWLSWCEDFNNKPLVKGCNNISIGDVVNFVRTKSSGRGCYTLTQCEGIVFAFNSTGTRMMIVYRGKLEQVSNVEAPEVKS